MKNEVSAYSAVHYITAFISVYCIILALVIFTYCVWFYPVHYCEHQVLAQPIYLAICIVWN